MPRIRAPAPTHRRSDPHRVPGARARASGSARTVAGCAGAGTSASNARTNSASGGVNMHRDDRLDFIPVGRLSRRGGESEHQKRGWICDPLACTEIASGIAPAVLKAPEVVHRAPRAPHGTSSRFTAPECLRDQGRHMPRPSDAREHRYLRHLDDIYPAPECRMSLHLEEIEILRAQPSAVV